MIATGTERDQKTDAKFTRLPHGTRLAVVRGSRGAREVFLVNADGTSLTQLTDDPADDCEPPHD